MDGRKTDTDESAWEIAGENYKEIPHGWIQWKGTSVCMDIFCKCGFHSHIDAEFAYNVQCPKCKVIYSCNQHIELIELKKEPENFILANK